MESDTYGHDPTESRQTELTASNISLVILAVFFVGLRFYSRWIKSGKFGIDDYGVLLALFFLFLLMTVGQLMIHYGLGLHLQTLSLNELASVLKCLLAFECIYVATIAIIKISVLLMYWRAFDIRTVRIPAIVLAAVVVAWAIAIIAVCVFQCTPISKAWEPMSDEYCINLKGSFVGNALPNILTDVAILALPIRQIWKLHHEWKIRLQLLIVFSLGSFVIFTSIYRFTTLFQFVPADTTWTLAPSCAWSIIECASGIISVCLPTLSPLIQCVSRKPVSRVGTSVVTETKSTISTSRHSQLSEFHRLDSMEDGDLNVVEQEEIENQVTLRPRESVRLPVRVYPCGRREYIEC